MQLIKLKQKSLYSIMALAMTANVHAFQFDSVTNFNEPKLASETGGQAEAFVPVWKAKAELGVVNTSGNTQTSSTNGKINVQYEAEKWRQEFRLEVLKSESQLLDENNQRYTQKTADRSYFLSQTNYKNSEKSYSFVSVDYADETFTSYDYIGNALIGYGYSFVKNKNNEFQAEVSAGKRRYQGRDEIEAEQETVSRLAEKWSYRLTESTKLNQELSATFGKEFDVYNFLLAVNVNINSSLAISLGYEAQHTTVVEASLEKTDAKTTINLVYNFL